MTMTTVKMRWCQHCLHDTEQHHVRDEARPYQCHTCGLHTV